MCANENLTGTRFNSNIWITDIDHLTTKKICLAHKIGHIAVNRFIIQLTRATGLDYLSFAHMRLAVYSGNLKRGAVIRELRTGRQVTQEEMADELEERFGDIDRGEPRSVPWSVYSVSTAERGITPMTDRTFFAYKAAVNTAAAGEGPRERRKLHKRMVKKIRRTA